MKEGMNMNEEDKRISELESEWYALKDLLKRTDFWWLCGRYVSRGRPLTNKKGVFAVIEKDKVNDIERFKALFREVSVEEGYVHMMDTSSMDSVFMVYVYDKGFGEFCTEMFGDGGENRFIDRRVKELSVDLLTAFLDGYMSGQGIHDRREWLWCCKSTSWRLMNDMQDIVMKVTRKPVTHLKITPPKDYPGVDTHVIMWHNTAGGDF